MTISPAMCSAFALARSDYDQYLTDAIRVAADALVEPTPTSIASAVARFEIIQDDAQCELVLADACVHLACSDTDVHFVAPDTAVADNYVSYWHRGAALIGGQPGWEQLPPGQQSATGEIYLLGQTIPTQILPEGSAGRLHHLPGRPGDGWTVSVGVHHNKGASALSGLALSVTVSARPDWTPEPDPQTVHLP